MAKQVVNMVSGGFRQGDPVTFLVHVSVRSPRPASGEGKGGFFVGRT